jgi:hypothetical protein
VILRTLCGAVLLLLWAAAPAHALGISDDGAMLANGGVQWAANHGFTDIRFQPHADDLERYDQAVADADRLGLRVIVSPLVRADRFIDVARRVRVRWPHIAALSAPNEPEIHGYDPCAYGRLYRRLDAAIDIPVLFGEFSPHGAWTYLKAIARCKAARTFRPRHISFHPYQWATDPLSPKQLDTQDGKGDWIGIGRLPRVKRWLGRLSTRKAFGLRVEPRIWITEFAYLTDLATVDQIGRWWPRAIIQADRLDAETIIAQGAVTSAPGRRWDSSLPHGVVRAMARSSI